MLFPNHTIGGATLKRAQRQTNGKKITTLNCELCCMSPKCHRKHLYVIRQVEQIVTETTKKRLIHQRMMTQTTIDTTHRAIICLQ